MDRPVAHTTPGVLTGIAADGPLKDEEIFGPVAVVFRVGVVDEVARLAKAAPFGLGSSVRTTDQEEHQRVVRDISLCDIEAGMTAISQIIATAPDAPFCGVRRSGRTMAGNRRHRTSMES